MLKAQLALWLAAISLTLALVASRLSGLTSHTDQTALRLLNVGEARSRPRA